MAELPSLVPLPSRVRPGQGVVDICPQHIRLALRADADCAGAAPVALLEAGLKRNGYCMAAEGFPLRLQLERQGQGAGSLGHEVAAGQKSEGYALTLDGDGLTLTAATLQGLGHGVQTLLQIFDGTQTKTPHFMIEDAPRFRWRGMMLDVARHFMPLPAIYKFIDALALHKMNVFHWHLTDDQGWRAQIRRYPKLTGVGSRRCRTIVGHRLQPYPYEFDELPHEGFYTQDDMRSVVAYAQARGIVVVPEIEMPGHSTAAIAAYPELSCKGEPMEVADNWGVWKNCFCPGEESVFTFLENVLDEILEIFPSPYIHIGGDECPRYHWKACPKCAARMRDNALADYNALQGYFTARIATYLHGKGRRLIGWDEILEAELPPSVLVTAWHGDEKGIEAARRGLDVIMAPGEWVYFDKVQSEDLEAEPLAIGGVLTLEKVYRYEPVPDGIATAAPDKVDHILGAQGQLWTEYIPDEKALEYMAFPRVCALAEVLWTPRQARDFKDFERRLSHHYSRLKQLGITNARISI